MQPGRDVDHKRNVAGTFQSLNLRFSRVSTAARLQCVEAGATEDAISRYNYNQLAQNVFDHFAAFHYKLHIVERRDVVEWIG